MKIYRDSLLQCQAASDAVDELHRCTVQHVTNFEDFLCRFATAIRQGDIVGVFGDYDCDGQTSTYLMIRHLLAIGCPLKHIHTIAASRSIGYGISQQAIDEFKRAYCKLVIVLDCGTNCAALRTPEIDQGTAQYIVIDHHLIDDCVNPSPQVHTVNPFVKAAYPSADIARTYCTAGLVYQMITPRDNAIRVAAAIGTCADMAEVNIYNQHIIRTGFDLILARETGMPSLDLLAKKLKVSTYSDIQWNLIPAINSSGRISDPRHICALLLETTVNEDLVEMMIAMHTLRKKYQNDGIKRAQIGTQMTYLPSQHQAVCISHSKFDGGVVGVVAGRISSSLGIPVAIGRRGAESTTYSLRAPDHVDMSAAYPGLKKIAERVGGHSKAGGATVLEQHRKQFEEAFRVYPFSTAPLANPNSSHHISLDDWSAELLAEWNENQPYGVGNVAPRFCSPAKINSKPWKFGDAHFRIELAPPLLSMDAELLLKYVALYFDPPVEQVQLIESLIPDQPVVVDYELVDINKKHTALTVKLHRIQPYHQGV